tara:strand:- start:922 stop:1641 length:720 start_codon:yes stop_codon:yes gene_type:complete
MDKKLTIILPVRNEKESLEIMIKLLNCSLDFEHEIIIVYDRDDDNSIDVAETLKLKISNLKIAKNEIGIGVKNAISQGVKIAKYDIILITAVDEIFPIIAIDQMISKIVEEDYDLVSGTRYSKGGMRIGGSLLGTLLSKVANKIFTKLTKFPLSDLTTGIKMMKKNVWKETELYCKPVGWAFALELSIKTFLNKNKIAEVPLKSVDRLFGGKSTFKPIPWIKEYFKWFIWGIIKLKKLR